MPQDNSNLTPLFYAAGNQYGIDPNLLMALSKQESGINPNIHDSYQGAKGLMQMLPATAMEMGATNPYDPAQAIPAAARYLAEGYAKTGTPEGAIQYYHGGPDQRQWGPKTKAYLGSVTANYTNMKKQPAQTDSYDDLIKKYTTPDSAPAPQAAPPASGGSYDDLIQKYSTPVATPAPASAPVSSARTAPDTDPGVQSIVADIADQVAGRPRQGRDISKDVPARDDWKTELTSPAIAAARLKTTAGYIGSQAAGVPAQIATDIASGVDQTKAGVSEIGSGNLWPSAPNGLTDPQSWQPGGILRAAGGVMGAAGAPVSGAVNQLVQQPVTWASGSPEMGARAGVVGNAIAGPLAGKALTGKLAYGSADPETLRLAQAADAWGIPIRNAQISNNPLIRKTDQIVGMIPGSGQAGARGEQVSAFGKAVSNTFGEDTPQITRQTLKQASDRIGGVMNDVEGRTITNIDQPALDRLANIDHNLRTALTPDDIRYKQVSSQIDGILNKAAANKGSLPGDTWKSLVTKDSPLNNLASSSDATIARPAQQIIETLRDAMQRSASPEDAVAYAKARFQYKNMKTVEPLVTRGTPGEISPLNLGTQVNKNFDPRNAGPLGDLSDIGQRFMRSPPDSGTPLGEKVINALTSTPALVAGGLVGGGGAHLMGFNPLDIAQGAVALGAGAMTARGTSMLLNNPLYRAVLLRKAETGNKLINPP